MNIADQINSSIKPTLNYTRALEDDTRPEMSDKQKRRLATFRQRYETRLRQTQRERYQQALNQIGEQQRTVQARVNEAVKEVSTIQRKVRAGRLSAEEGRKRLAPIFKQINDDRRLLDALDESVARAEAMIDTDPADYQESLLERWPALEQSLPVLSVVYLNGDDQHDPFGG